MTDIAIAAIICTCSSVSRTDHDDCGLRLMPGFHYKRRRPGGLPTARTALRTGCVRVLVFCNSCRHQADADLNALVESGCGDVPLTELQFRCSRCGTDRTDFVVTARDNPQL